MAQAKRFGSHPVSARSAPFVVLGAGGFIGTALVAWLESRGHLVHAVTIAVVSMTDKDITARVTPLGNFLPKTAVFDHDWGRIDDGTASPQRSSRLTKLV